MRRASGPRLVLSTCHVDLSTGPVDLVAEGRECVHEADPFRVKQSHPLRSPLAGLQASVSRGTYGLDGS